MSAQNQDTPLVKKAKKVLLAIAIDVSREDKKRAAKEIGVSNMTISRYLRGDVKDIGTAEQLIQFFKPIVSKRKNNIAA